jgi:hypothetical protein
VFSRILPLAERFDVYLLGTGLPSFWVAHMGEMRLTVGLSGWTANDWTRGSALDLIAPPAAPSADLIDSLAGRLRERRSATFAELESDGAAGPAEVAAGLRHLAHTGQVICDLAGGVYRWRQLMPQALGEAEMGPEHPELAESKKIIARRWVRIESREDAPRGGVVLCGDAGGQSIELLIDGDGRVKRGKCGCEHYRKFGMRNGPCRHMLAMRSFASAANSGPSEETIDSFKLLNGRDERRG